MPDIERSAGESFRAVQGLAWIADDDVMSAEEHLRYIEAGTVWVAEDAAGKIVGFLTAEQVEGELHVWQLAVRHDRQGQGFGRCLMEAALKYARASGLAAVTLTTFRDIAWNQPFYARLGFETLEDTRIGSRLARILEREKAHGLPSNRRCAMRLPLRFRCTPDTEPV